MEVKPKPISVTVTVTVNVTVNVTVPVTVAVAFTVTTVNINAKPAYLKTILDLHKDNQWLNHIQPLYLSLSLSLSFYLSQLSLPREKLT